MRPVVGRFRVRRGLASDQILGTTVIGGMLASTLIAIFLIPVMFYVVKKITHRNGKGKHKAPPGGEVDVSQPAGVSKH